MRNSILVNNAGICEMRPFAMSTIESVWRQVEVNFKGVCYHLCPHVKLMGDAAIDNFVSRSPRNEAATSGMHHQYCISIGNS